MMFAGVLIHQLFPESFPLVILGVILIFIAPISMYRQYERRIYEDPAKTEVGEWRDLPIEKLRELLELIPHVSSTTSGGAGRWADVGGLVTVILVAGAISFQFGTMLIIGGVVSVITLIDLTLVAISIYRFYGGSLKAHPVSLQANALDHFMTFSLPDGFAKKFQAHIVKDVNGDPDILNVRMQLQPNNPISGLLCMMATISRTNVKGSNYPFAYFVIVFGGTAFCKKSTSFENKLQTIVTGSSFHIETNINDGNSVFVILPNKPKYQTNDSDCERLCEIMSECCNLCLTDLEEIEKIAVPYKKK